MAPGIWQILLIVLVILLLFGAGKLPRIMGDLAKGVGAFKRGLKDEGDETASRKLEKKDDES
ncbi:MAG: twin-arginine translocase TatA/TatE family subunit [Alphaproteobacteria bacterium]|nr:twin-arginine translocase TatA/TatE family subunit [Alphaproteobacteria bacterium]